MKRDLTVFLSMQIIAMVVAILSFRFIEVRWQAALVAGVAFVIVGVAMVLRSLKWTNRFRYLSFYAARIHLYLFSLPMLLVRWRYSGHDFSQIQVMGIPGPVFHRWAEMFYMALVAATLIDLIRERRGLRKSPRVT